MKRTGSAGRPAVAKRSASGSSIQCQSIRSPSRTSSWRMLMMESRRARKRSSWSAFGGCFGRIGTLRMRFRGNHKRAEKGIPGGSEIARNRASLSPFLAIRNLPSGSKQRRNHKTPDSLRSTNGFSTACGTSPLHVAENHCDPAALHVEGPQLDRVIRRRPLGVQFGAKFLRVGFVIRWLIQDRQDASRAPQGS